MIVLNEHLLLANEDLEVRLVKVDLKPWLWGHLNSVDRI